MLNGNGTTIFLTTNYIEKAEKNAGIIFIPTSSKLLIIASMCSRLLYIHKLLVNMSPAIGYRNLDGKDNLQTIMSLERSE